MYINENYTFILEFWELDGPLHYNGNVYVLKVNY